MVININLKKIIKKYELEENGKNDNLWMDVCRIWCISSFKEVQDWLLKCYPYKAEKITSLEQYKDDFYYKVNDNWYEECFVNLAKKILGKNCKFIFSEKINPLICVDKKETIALCIAPRISDDIPEMYWDLGYKNIFKEMTGCKCPKIIERKK